MSHSFPLHNLVCSFLTSVLVRSYANVPFHFYACKNSLSSPRTLASPLAFRVSRECSNSPLNLLTLKSMKRSPKIRGYEVT